MSIQTDDFAPAPRVVSPRPTSPAEDALERALRPKQLTEYVGQAKVREQLDIFIGAARRRAAPMKMSRRWTTCCCLVRRGWAKPR